jgi:hypothetical protein
MAVRVRAEDYRRAAGERVTEAGELRRAQRYTLAMYVSGLAAECMLRAYHRAEAPFDERHDVLELLKDCDLDRLGEAAMTRLRAPVQTVHLLWNNSFRYFDEKGIRAYLKSMRQDRRGVQRGADFLKVRCKELEDACLEIVTVGEDRWG